MTADTVLQLPTYSELLALQAGSRLAFGRMLLNWRRRNGWTQYTAFTWAEAIGEPKLVISYGNLSVIEQGKAGEMRQRAFWQLWELNRRIASGDWGRIGDAELRQKLEAAIPIGDADCPVWGPLEFWACYCGLRPMPEAFAMSPAPVIGPRQAAQLSSRWRQQLRTQIDEHRLDPGAALAELMQLAEEEHRKTSTPCSPAFAPTAQTSCRGCGWRRIATVRSCGWSSGNGRCRERGPRNTRRLDALNPSEDRGLRPPHSRGPCNQALELCSQSLGSRPQ